MAKKIIKRNYCAKRGSSSKTSSKKPFRFFGVVAMMVTFGVVATYVSVVNASAVKGDKIRDLERQIAIAQERAENLVVEEANLRAFVTPVDDVKFVVIDVAAVQTITANVTPVLRKEVVALR